MPLFRSLASSRDFNIFQKRKGLGRFLEKVEEPDWGPEVWKQSSWACWCVCRGAGGKLGWREPLAVLLGHSSVTKRSVIVRSLYQPFPHLFHLLYSFLQSHLHLHVGVRGGGEEIILSKGTCVFASSLIHENILCYWRKSLEMAFLKGR